MNGSMHWRLRPEKCLQPIEPVGFVAGRDTNRIEIFSGITYAPSRRVGSWAVILSYGRHVKILGGTEQGSSANQFHLLAAIAGLSVLKRPLPVTLYTTSGYLRDGISRWLAGWQRRGWLTSEGKAVSNRAHWQRVGLSCRQL